MSGSAVPREREELNSRFALLQACFFGAYAGTSFFSYILQQKGTANELIGLLGALTSCASTLVQPVWGILCDRYRCHRYFYLLSGAAMPLVYTALIRAEGAGELALCALLSGMFINCIQNMGNGWVSSLNAQGRHINYGACRSCGSLAFALMAAGLGRALQRWGYSGLVGGMALGGLLCAAVAFTIPRGQTLPGERERLCLGEGLRILVRQRDYMIVICGGFLAMAGVAGLSAYFSAYLATLGAGPAAVGVGNFAYAIAEVPFMFLYARLRRRFSFRALLGMSLLAPGLQCLLVGLAPNYAWAILAMLLQGPGFGTLVPCLVAYTAAHVEERYMSTAHFFTTAVSLSASMIIGSVLAGLLSHWFTLPVIFLLLSLLPFAGCALLLLSGTAREEH